MWMAREQTWAVKPLSIVHIAWSFAFESHTEKWLWRISSLTITCIPSVLFVGFWLDTPIEPVQILGLPFALLAGIFYVFARFFFTDPTFCDSAFSSTRSIPDSALDHIHATHIVGARICVNS